jgi:hypothetical protein
LAVSCLLVRGIMSYALFRNILISLNLLLLFTAVALASQVKCELSLEGGKTQFRSGETIGLQLSFTADGPGVSVNATTTEPPSPIDTVVLTPMKGAFSWLEDQARGKRYSPDYAQIVTAEPNQSVSVTLTLNDLYRFDRPGHYTVHITTRRVSVGDGSSNGSPPFSDHPQELTSNDVSFDVVPFPVQDEAALASSLEQRIRASTDQSSAQKLADELDFLTGDAGTAAKLSLFLDPKTFDPFAVDVARGLWIARNRPMVVVALERAIVDPAQTSADLVGTLVALKATLQPSHNPEGIKAEYLHQIALSIPKRTGESRVDAARTVFVTMAQDGHASGPDFDIARETIVTHFSEVNEYSVEWILNSYGKYLLDPRLVPALRQILETTTDPVFSGNREAALTQLTRIAPDAKIAPGDASTYLVREACSEHPAMIRTVRDLSPMETLPEADTCLREKLIAETNGAGTRMMLGTTIQYIARFADAALLSDVRKAYAERTDRWDQRARGAALTYLMRWDAKNSRPLLDELLLGPDSSDGIIMVDVLEPEHDPADGLREAFREYLQTAPPKIAAWCAFALSKIGEPEDREVLRKTLEQVRSRDAAEFSHGEGKFEVELVTAVAQGRSWESTKDEIIALQQTCVSRECRQMPKVQ